MRARLKTAFKFADGDKLRSMQNRDVEKNNKTIKTNFILPPFDEGYKTSITVIKSYFRSPSRRCEFYLCLN